MSNPDCFNDDLLPRCAPRPSSAVASVTAVPLVPEVSLLMDRKLDSPQSVHCGQTSTLPYKRYSDFKKQFRPDLHEKFTKTWVTTDKYNKSPVAETSTTNKQVLYRTNNSQNASLDTTQTTSLQPSMENIESNAEKIDLTKNTNSAKESRKSIETENNPSLKPLFTMDDIAKIYSNQIEDFLRQQKQQMDSFLVKLEEITTNKWRKCTQCDKETQTYQPCAIRKSSSPSLTMDKRWFGELVETSFTSPIEITPKTPIKSLPRTSFRSKILQDVDLNANHFNSPGTRKSDVLSGLPTPTTDRSLAMNALALKYLPEDTIKGLNNPNEEITSPGVYSAEEINYMEKHGLLQQLKQANLSTPTKKATNDSDKSKKILDHAAIKKLPKLL